MFQKPPPSFFSSAGFFSNFSGPHKHLSFPSEVHSPTPWASLRLGEPETASHDQASSTVHELEQPSSSCVFASSHCSFTPSTASRKPSPQVGFAQLDLASFRVLQTKPCSISQLDEHPSPSTSLPSSHFSTLVISADDCCMPSPHVTCLHTDLPSFSVHFHPASIKQTGEHPSPSSVLPSSHVSFTLESSAICSFPSPHTTLLHTDAEPILFGLHCALASILQSWSHPSPGYVLASSQPSSDARRPSPHIDTHSLAYTAPGEWVFLPLGQESHDNMPRFGWYAPWPHLLHSAGDSRPFVENEPASHILTHLSSAIPPGAVELKPSLHAEQLV
mmetsp:Transcript_79105/g.128187  ORF Transcript_79105/g.128187 Transcript_79105/m.128187 type:complete len:332 (-) Transcript_79105:765-1760(-)